VSTTPNEPEWHEPESEQPAPQRPGVEPGGVRDAFRDLENQPRSDEVGDTAYAAVPPPLPSSGDPAQDRPGQYGGAQYGDAQYGSPQYGDTQYGSAGPYQAAPPPPQYGQPYGYQGQGGGPLPGMPPLADWSQRATAFILDNGVAVVAGWVSAGNVSKATDVVFGIIGLVGVVWAIINAVRAGREGQSYGKRVMGIRLARLADGQPIGAGLGFLRLFLNWLLWVLCVIPGVLNLLWPLWDGKKQTWSDKLAKSVVVKSR
jgi:uncharacterized RDD family membrane protein YckC